MATAVKSATRVQIGKESTPGTPVAATRRLLLNSATYRIQEGLEMFEDEMTGLLVRSANGPVVHRNHTELEVSGHLDFEQILFPLLAGVKGGVSPTTPGTGEARLWTFTPDVSADPAIDPYTVEFAERDFASSPNELGYESAYAFVSAFQIQGGEEGIPQWSATVQARKAKSASSTGALSLPTRSHAGNLKWALYIDTSWANLGNTQVSGQVYSHTIDFGEMLVPGFYQDGRADLDFTRPEIKAGRRVNLQISAVVDPTALVASEETAKTNGTLRFVRLEITGDAFDSPDDGLNRFIRLDGAFVHTEDSMSERGATDREGLAAITLNLTSQYDPTQGQDVELSVQNTLTAFP